MTAPNESVRRWQEWLEGDLFQAVHGLVQLRDVFLGYNDLLGRLPERARTPGLFHSWTTHNYVNAMALGVRRMCDEDPRTASLARLLTELAERPDQLEGEWWLGGVGACLGRGGIT